MQLTNRLVRVLSFGLLWANVIGCDGSSSTESQREAVRLAKQHFVQQFPDIAYDNVYIESGPGGSWRVKFESMADRRDEELDGERTWLKSPVLIVVDRNGKCSVASSEIDD